MKKFNVNYFVDDAEQIAGSKAHSGISFDEEVEASSADEAIEFFIDWVRDNNNSFEIDVDSNNNIYFTDPLSESEKPFQEIYNITAKEMEN